MKPNKAPGPDVPAKFYQVFWSLNKDNLIAMFKDFRDGNLPLYTLNFGSIPCYQSKRRLKQIQQYKAYLYA
jgi:hypothetical protein